MNQCSNVSSSPLITQTIFSTEMWRGYGNWMSFRTEKLFVRSWQDKEAMQSQTE